MQFPVSSALLDIMWPLFRILTLFRGTCWPQSLFLFVMTRPNLRWLLSTEVLVAVNIFLFSKSGINLILLLWTDWNLLFLLLQWRLLFLCLEDVLVSFQPLSPCLQSCSSPEEEGLVLCLSSSYAGICVREFEVLRLSTPPSYLNFWWEYLWLLWRQKLYRILQRY